MIDSGLNNSCLGDKRAPFLQREKYIAARLVFFCLSFCIGDSLQGQQWPVGHQPPTYTVPQYRSPSQTQPASEIERRRPVDHPPAPSVLQENTITYPLYEDNSQSSQPGMPVQPESLPLLQESNAPLLTQDVLPLPIENVKHAQKPRLDYSLYRDISSFPVDPRKPCNVCTDPNGIREFCQIQWPGKKGRPYQEVEPGACQCSAASCKRRDNFSVNWPGPFSAICNTNSSAGATVCGSSRPQRRVEHLASLKLIDYQRTDNGYCGPGADPYGCLGESRVMGVGFRQPGQPAVAPISGDQPFQH